MPLLGRLRKVPGRVLPVSAARLAHTLRPGALAVATQVPKQARRPDQLRRPEPMDGRLCRSEEHTSELQSLMRISYAVFCLTKKKSPTTSTTFDRITAYQRSED